MAPRLLLPIVAACIFSVNATTYYVSTSKSNGNDGRSEAAAWQTLAFACAHVTAGDQILLKCGEVFRESTLTLPNTVSLGSFGSGARPVLSGAVEITGWTAWAGHPGIFYATVSVLVKNLFVNNRLMLIARYPNTGWLTTSANDAASRVVSSTGLALCPRNAAGYWNTARMRWRHWNWYYDTRIVASYAANGTMTLAGTPVQDVGNSAKDWGFYMDGLLTELDTTGEWFYDAASHRVYLYPPAGVAPSGALVEGMVARRGLSVSASAVQGIAFRQYSDKGLDVNGPGTIDGCRFEGIGSDSGGSALSVNWGSAGARITHCSFEGNLNVSISSVRNPAIRTETLIEYDTVRTSGTVPGYGGRGSWHGVGILLNVGNSTRVRYCRLDSTGYAGILVGGAGNIAEYNFINHAMATMVDGAGIYTNCDSTIFRRNIIVNTIGSWDGSPFHLEGGAGIWPEFLEHFKGQRIEDNTLAYCHRGCGIFLPNNFSSVIKGNVCYDNATGMHIEGGFYTDDNLPMHDSIVGNAFYTIMDGRQALTYRPEYNYGVFSGNYYCNPGTDNVIGQYNAPPGNVWNCVPHTLNWWLANWSQHDAQAKTDPIKRAAPTDLRGSSRLVYNDELVRKTIALDNGVYVNLDNQQVIGSVALDPFTSIILVHTGQTAATVSSRLGRDAGDLVVLTANRAGVRFAVPRGGAVVTIVDARGCVIDKFTLAGASTTWRGRFGRMPAAGVYTCIVNAPGLLGSGRRAFQVAL